LLRFYGIEVSSDWFVLIQRTPQLSAHGDLQTRQFLTPRFEDLMQEPTDTPVPNGFIFIVGAPKCATTTLHRWLMAHPGVGAFRSTKEPRHFTDFGDWSWTGPGTQRLVSKLVTDRQAYLRGFCIGPDGGRGLDSSTDYLSCEVSPGMIAAFAETAEVRVIAVLRDPIARAFSEYQHTRRDGMQQDGFTRSLELEPERIAAGMAPLFHHVRRSRYHAPVHRYREAFGDRFLLLDGHVLKNSEALRERLATFLNLPGLSLDTELRANASHVARYPALTALLRHPAVKAVARRIVPRSLRSRAYDKVTRLNQTRLALTDEEADLTYDLMAGDIEACIADPFIPTDNWTTVAAVRRRRGIA
jgi:hypothetical protein